MIDIASIHRSIYKDSYDQIMKITWWIMNADTANKKNSSALF